MIERVVVGKKGINSSTQIKTLIVVQTKTLANGTRHADFFFSN